MFSNHLSLGPPALEIMMKKLLQTSLSNELEGANWLEVIPMIINNLAEQQAAQQTEDKPEIEEEVEISGSEASHLSLKHVRENPRWLGVAMDLRASPITDKWLFLRLALECAKELRKFKRNRKRKEFMKDVNTLIGNLEERLESHEMGFKKRAFEVRSVETEFEKYFEAESEDLEGKDEDLKTFKMFRNMNRYKCESADVPVVAPVPTADPELARLLSEIDF